MNSAAELLEILGTYAIATPSKWRARKFFILNTFAFFNLFIFKIILCDLFNLASFDLDTISYRLFEDLWSSCATSDLVCVISLRSVSMKYKSSGEPSMFAVSFCLSFNAASITFCGSLRVVSSVRINEGWLLAKH